MAFPRHKREFYPNAGDFFSNVAGVRPQTVREKLTQWQLRRRIEFSPDNACDSAVSEIASWGQTFSFRQEEDFQDAVTLDEIFAWRDYLLQAEPYIIKLRTTE